MSQKHNTHKAKAKTQVKQTKAKPSKPFPKAVKKAKKPEVVLERTKKKTGLKPGSRNLDAPAKSAVNELQPQRDPRLGSKKPVALDA